MSLIHDKRSEQLLRRLKSESGALRPVQYVLILIGVAILYSLVCYAPSLLNQMTISSIADDAAARMNVTFDDEVIRSSIVKQSASQGVPISPANIKLVRQQEPFIENSVSITWHVTVDHFWGSTESYDKTVTRRARFGEK